MNTTDVSLSMSVSVLVYGDSIVANLPLPDDDAFIQWNVQSLVGLTLERALQMEQQQIGLSSLLLNTSSSTSEKKCEPKKTNLYQAVILCLGSNDVGHGFTIEEIVKNMKQMIEFVRTFGIKHIGWIGMPQRDVESYEIQNKSVRIYCESTEDVQFLECFHPSDIHSSHFQADGIHPSAIGRVGLAMYLQDFVIDCF